MTALGMPRHDTVTAAPSDPEADPEAADALAEAHRLLRRLLEVEDRPGLVYPLIDEARRLLARAART